MELLILWISTCITSFGLEIALEFRQFKDIADAGFKIKIERLNELSKELNTTKTTLLEMLIPIYNIMSVFERNIKYNNMKPFILDELNIIDALDSMNEEELEKYQNNPSGFNALLITVNNKIQEENITNNFNCVEEKEFKSSLEQKRQMLEDYKNELLSQKENNSLSLTRKKKDK